MKKFLGILLVLVMCMQVGGNIPMGYAEEMRADRAAMVNGKVTQAEPAKEKISLAGIEIQVFSSELDRSVSAADLEVYNSTYEFSVFCDEGGNYSFVPPSKDYAIAVNLTSLPERTGITEAVTLLKQGEKLPEIGLCPIARVTAQYDEGQMVARAYASDGTGLHALCSENEMDTGFAYLMKDSASTRAVSASMEGIRNLESVSKGMQINVNGVCVETSHVYDLSKMYLSERIDLLYSLNILSEDERMALYRDLTTLTPEESGLLCGTELIRELEKNREGNRETSDENRDTILRSHVGPYLKEGLINVDIGSGNYYYQVHYEAGTGGPNATVLASVVTAVRDAHNFFVNHGFHVPRKPTGEIYYHIYIISGLVGYTGVTVKKDVTANTAASYIELKFDSGEQYSTVTNQVTDVFKSALAHEMFHAISYTYRYSMPSWFSESFATWAGLRYTANGSVADGYVSQYLPDTSVSPHDMKEGSLMQYGFCVFPLTLDMYNGGIPTIRKIIEATENTSNGYTAIQKGIEAANQSYTMAGEALNHCSLHISKPTVFYTMATSGWGEASCVTRSDTESYTVTGDAFTSSRYGYGQISSVSKTLSISVRRNAGVLGTGLVRIKQDGTTEVVAPASSSNSLVTYVIHNYGTTYRKVILSLVNGSVSADNLNCTVSSTVN